MSIETLTIAKADLETALNQTGYSLGKEAEWTSHYFFRSNSKGVDIHTTNHRHCSSIPITTCSVHTDENAGAFTLSSASVRKLLRHIDTANALVFKNKTNKVTAKTARGDIHFAISKNEFPYWDDALDEADHMLTIDAAKLIDIIAHHKNFVHKPDAKNLLYRYIAFQDGGVLSGNGFSMCLTLSDDLKGANFYLTQVDINPLVGFLKNCEGDVTIKKTNKMVFFVASNEALFGLVYPSKRAIAGMGGLNITQMATSLTDSLADWSTPKDNVLECLGLLGCVMSDDDSIVKFSFEDGSLFISGKSQSGDVDKLEVGLKTFNDDKKTLDTPMYFNRNVYTKVLSLLEEDDISVEVLRSLNNSPVVNHKVSGYTTYSLIVPLQTATF